MEVIVYSTTTQCVLVVSTSFSRVGMEKLPGPGQSIEAPPGQETEMLGGVEAPELFGVP